MNRQKTKQAALVSTSVMAAGMAHGAILYSGPVNQIATPSQSFDFSLDGSGLPEFQVGFDGYGSGNSSKPFINGTPSGSNNAFVLAYTNSVTVGDSSTEGGLPVIPFGTTIDGSFTVGTNLVDFGALRAYFNDAYNNNNLVGEWSIGANTTGYVGLELTNATSTNFGWVEVTLTDANPSSATITILDYAYETTAGEGIPTGAEIEPGAPVIYTPPGSESVPGGAANVQLTVQAIASPAPTYQWLMQPSGGGAYTALTDGGDISGSATATLTINGASSANQGNYIVVVSNSLGAATSSPPAALTVVPAVVAGPTPNPANIYAGLTVQFNVNVSTGLTSTNAWFKNGAQVVNGGNISGAATTNLVISNLVATNAGSYTFVVSTAYGSVTSSVAPLTVVQPDGSVYEAAVLAAGPVDYYRLDEIGSPSSGSLLAYDFVGGNNGIYGTDVQNGSESIYGPIPSEGFIGFTSTNYAAEFALSDPLTEIALAPWNLNTNTVTMTAWVYPEGNQAPGAGIVFTRSTNDMVCGIFYSAFDQNTNGNGDYNLTFDWNDAQAAWYWNSYVSVPQYQWDLVALVVTPTNATLYVVSTNGVSSAVDTLANPVQSFNATEYIGEDPKDITSGNNNFNGSIDEVAIFNQALSSNQISTLYNAALGIPAPTTLYINQVGASVQLTWAGGGTLLQATNVLGPWVTNNAATSPYLVSPTAPKMFYQVVSH